MMSTQHFFTKFTPFCCKAYWCGARKQT